MLALNPCPRSTQVGEFEVVIRENTSRKKKNFITNQFNHFLMHVFAKKTRVIFFNIVFEIFPHVGFSIVFWFGMTASVLGNCCCCFFWQC